MLQGVYKVYSGKTGCMCGCRGKYSYTAEGAELHGPGYDVSDMVNERSVKIIAGKVLRNPNSVREDNYIYFEENGRILVAYLAE
jgi:hypothetical protein